MKKEDPSRKNIKKNNSDTGKLLECSHYLRGILKRELSISSDSSIEEEAAPQKTEGKHVTKKNRPVKKHVENVTKQEAPAKLGKC